MTKPKRTENYLTLKEVSERLNYARSSIYGLMKRKKFPQGIKKGMHRYWKWEDVEEWITEQRYTEKKGVFR